MSNAIRSSVGSYGLASIGKKTIPSTPFPFYSLKIYDYSANNGVYEESILLDIRSFPSNNTLSSVAGKLASFFSQNELSLIMDGDYYTDKNGVFNFEINLNATKGIMNLDPDIIKSKRAKIQLGFYYFNGLKDVVDENSLRTFNIYIKNVEYRHSSSSFFLNCEEIWAAVYKNIYMGNETLDVSQIRTESGGVPRYPLTVYLQQRIFGSHSRDFLSAVLALGSERNLSSIGYRSVINNMRYTDIERARFVITNELEEIARGETRDGSSRSHPLNVKTQPGKKTSIFSFLESIANQLDAHLFLHDGLFIFTKLDSVSLDNISFQMDRTGRLANRRRTFNDYEIRKIEGILDDRTKGTQILDYTLVAEDDVNTIWKNVDLMELSYSTTEAEFIGNPIDVTVSGEDINATTFKNFYIPENNYKLATYSFKVPGFVKLNMFDRFKLRIRGRGERGFSDVDSRRGIITDFFLSGAHGSFGENGYQISYKLIQRFSESELTVLQSSLGIYRQYGSTLAEKFADAIAINDIIVPGVVQSNPDEQLSQERSFCTGKRQGYNQGDSPLNSGQFLSSNPTRSIISSPYAGRKEGMIIPFHGQDPQQPDSEQKITHVLHVNRKVDNSTNPEGVFMSQIWVDDQYGELIAGLQEEGGERKYANPNNRNLGNGYKHGDFVIKHRQGGLVVFKNNGDISIQRDVNKFVHIDGQSIVVQFGNVKMTIDNTGVNVGNA